MKYNGVSIADLLETTVEDALALLDNIPQIKQKLQTLVDVGLGYLHLGQSATTLSGGEAQRIKLAGSCAAVRQAAPSTSSTSQPPACISTTCAGCSTC